MLFPLFPEQPSTRFVPLVTIRTPRRGMKEKYPFPGVTAPLRPVAGRPSVRDASCHEGCLGARSQAPGLCTI